MTGQIAVGGSGTRRQTSRSDGAIGRDVRRLLAERLHGQAAGVRAEVKGGAVFLSGELHDSAALEDLTARIAGLEGVTTVRTTLGHDLDRWHWNPIWNGSVSTYGARARHHMTNAEIETLTEDECLRLLRSRTLGRIALTVGEQPQIFPVNYAMEDRDIVFRTEPGTKLAQAPHSAVAFEVDDVDTDSGIAWSVVVQGVAYEVTTSLDQRSSSLRSTEVEPMAPGERQHWMAVYPNVISGRRFRTAA
jgi:nitroimidazol reductase NimA-like FMN-containing flavoprotein (pyridoxamine 5'-phosphate oxidase superfamily)